MDVRRHQRRLGRGFVAWLAALAIMLQTLLAPLVPLQAASAVAAESDFVICGHNGAILSEDEGAAINASSRPSGPHPVDHSHCCDCACLQIAKTFAPASVAVAGPIARYQPLEIARAQRASRAFPTKSYASRAPPAEA